MEPSQSFEIIRIARTIEQLLGGKKPHAEERRADTRQPFFASVTVAVKENGEQRNYSCFSRDISPTSIGLLHNMPLESGEVVLTIPRQSGAVRFRGEVIWCHPCGEGWYLSGVRFLAVI